MQLTVPPGPVLRKSRRAAAGLAAAILFILLPPTPALPVPPDYPLFAAPFVSFDPGPGVSALAVGDLDGDGKPDVVVTRLPDTLTVLLGKGDGTFGPPWNCRTGSGPASVALGDLNNDGKPDLAVANRSDSTLSVFLGDGTGTFGTRRDYATGNGPCAVAIGDLNGDGKPDLAVANQYSNTVSVLPGNGDGTFGTRIDSGEVTSPVSLAIGDLDGDAKPDLVVGNQIPYYIPMVTILRGNGDGTFFARDSFFVGGTSAASVTIANLDGDGKADLVVGNDVNAVLVFLGRGDGTFNAGSQYSTRGSRSVAVAGLDHDGAPDLAVSRWAVSILRGNGVGKFPTRTDYPTGGGAAIHLAVADLNGDGNPDLVTADSDNFGFVSVHLGNGDGTFGPSAHSVAVDFPTSVVLCDLNDDRRLDLVTTGGAQMVTAFPGNGDGTFGPGNGRAAGFNLDNDFAIGDLDGDGKPDLVATSYWDTTVSVFPGNGDATFGAGRSYRVDPYPTSAAIGDLNGDGRSDLAVACYWSRTVSVLLGHGGATFTPVASVATDQHPRSVAIGDLNEDGRPDLAVATWVETDYAPGSLSVFPGNGDGTFGIQSDHLTPSRPTAVLVSDLDRDGRRELVVVSDLHLVSVFPGSGNAIPGAAGDSAVGVSSGIAALGDLNGDGYPDLAVVHRPCAVVSVRLGNGDRTFGPRIDYGTIGIEPAGNVQAGYAWSVAIGDLNGDGKRDLVVANGDFNTVTVLLNTGAPAVPPALPTALTALAPRPNPSHGATEIRFLLPAAGVVGADIVDVTGRKVRTLDSAGKLTPGEQALSWDGRDSRGRVVPDGVYFARIRAGRETVTAKMVHLK